MAGYPKIDSGTWSWSVPIWEGMASYCPNTVYPGTPSMVVVAFAKKNSTLGSSGKVVVAGSE
jgi:hypothetical protein